MTAATTATTALVIVESHFGNTRTIARAVAAGLADAGVRASVLDVDRAGAPPGTPRRPHPTYATRPR